MAAAIGTEDSALRKRDSDPLGEVRERLFREPYGFNFFQAVRLLGLLQPTRSPVGRYANPEEETVRFGGNPSLNFPASEIQSLTERTGSNPAMEVNFLGLFGPMGVLPNFMTELVADRVRVRDTGLRDFLDIFNHRLTSFFYQAWEKSHFTVGYERDRSDPVTQYLLALVGLGTPQLRNRQTVRDEAFVYYAGLTALSSKPGAALEAVLSDYFDAPAEVEPFIGIWRKIDEQDQCLLDESSESTLLGLGAVAGDEIWDQQSRIRLRIGPLSAVRYQEFLPTGVAWPALRAITKMFCGNDLEVEVQLVLRREEVPACELGNAEEDGPELGWQTWLKSKPDFAKDAVVVVGGFYGD